MINLGDKNWGVKDSGLLAYKQVGSKYFNKDFDFTRASNGTYVDKNGVLQTAELYNLIEYSQDFSQWTANNATLTTGQSGYDGSSNAWLLESTSTSFSLYQNYTQSGITTFSIYAKQGTSTNFGIDIFTSVSTNAQFFNLSDGSLGSSTGSVISANIIDIGNGWYHCIVTTNNTGTIYYARITNGVGNTYIQDAQLVEGTEPLDYQYTNGRVGIPRIDFSDGVGALLLEPQRTNLIPYSEDFTQWILQSNVNLTQNAAQSPEGLNNAFKYNISANTQRAIDYNLLLSSGNTYTFSLYVKPIVDTTIRIRDGAGWVEEIEVLAANGWQRIESTYSVSSDAYNIGFFDVSGDDGDRFYFYGAQIELGSYKTSYIKSDSGSTTTRIADVANNCGTEQDFNSEEGVLYVEIAALANDGTNRIFGISDRGDFNNSVLLRYASITNRITAQVRLSGVYQCTLNYEVSDATEFNKIAFKYKENDFSLWVNGLERDTDGSGNVVTGLNVFDFDVSSTNEFYGKVRSVKYFPTALGDTQLMTLTGGDGSLQGLFNSFEERVLAGGGYIESQDCIINGIKELL